MEKLNYYRVVALQPTVYTSLVNKLGQTLELVEHPLRGDKAPVVILYHAEKLAVLSDFYDTEDMLAGGDYEPVYMYGEMQCTFECMNLKGGVWL